MKRVLLITFLLFLPVCAFADYDVKPIQNLIHKMDAEIIKRNKLVDDIGIPENRMAEDTLVLSDFNLSELSVEFSLDALTDFLLMLNNTEKEKDKTLTKKLIDDFKFHMSNICTADLLQMHSLKFITVNLKIKQEFEVQIENTSTACYMLAGGIFNNKKFTIIY